ncbi:MAG TPA: antibiotic biosynthesis monooxygenase family protein [Anaerolineaceae bacterium]
MIIRIFRAKVRPGKQAEFERMVEQLSIPLVQAQRGMLAFYPGQLIGQHAHEFVLITIWRDVESLKAFTGRNWLHSILPEEDLPVLEEVEASGYEVFGLPESPRQLFNMI